jgi:hypothetical protein
VPGLPPGDLTGVSRTARRTRRDYVLKIARPHEENPVPAPTVIPLAPKVRIEGKSRDALRKTMRASYERGASVRDLAATHGRSYGFVHDVLTEAGTHFRPRGGQTR